MFLTVTRSMEGVYGVASVERQRELMGAWGWVGLRRNQVTE